jgi:hypothetical protein
MPWGDGSYPTNAVTAPLGAAWSATGNCAWCHTTENLNVHHITPQSVAPELANVPANWIVLCRRCHFSLGHRCNWQWYNPEVEAICGRYTNRLPCVPGAQP